MRTGGKITVVVLGTAIVVAIGVSVRRTMVVSRTHWCDNQMSVIDGAKSQYAAAHGQTNGDLVTPEQTAPYIKDGVQVILHGCPSGGQYDIGKVGDFPRCSIHGTWRWGLIYRY